MAAKRFMFVCIGILALACAYAIGAGNSVAQTSPTYVQSSHMTGGSTPATVVITSMGDVYARAGFVMGVDSNVMWSNTSRWTFMGNCFAGAVVGNETNTIGGVKSLFR